MPRRRSNTGKARTRVLLMTASAALTALGGCDFSRPAGVSAWDGSSAWYGSASPPAVAAAPLVASRPLPAPPPPAPPPMAPTSAVATPTVPPLPPAPALSEREPVSLTPPPGRPEAAPSAVAASNDVASVATAPVVAVATPPVTYTLPPIVTEARSIRLSGRLYRSFGDLGRLSIDEGLVLTESGSGSPTAWCAVAGTPRLSIVSAQGVCFYDRDGDNLLETLAIIGQPELGYMELGPFAFTRIE